MRHFNDAAIGGYFALDAASGPSALPIGDRAIGYQSARCAMAAALQSAGADRVWLPNFICGAVRSAVEWGGIESRTYCLAGDRGVPHDLVVCERDLVICVDYFGLTGGPCRDAVSRFGAHRVLVDCAQALFSPPLAGVATVYSPRKFAGIPDGGLLVSARQPAPPLAPDEAASVDRSQALRARAEGRVADGYTLFQAAEASLADCTPRAMSWSTARALAFVDWQAAGRRRVENYLTLADLLATNGLHVPPLPPGATPLCCPVPFTDAARARRLLAGQEIFTPVYWPDAELPPNDRIAHELRDHTIYLPCDQRYDKADMLRVAQALLKLRGNR